MIKFNIVAVGKLKERFWTDAVAEYVKRISKYATLKITEVAESADNGAAGASIQQIAEGKQLLSHAKGCVILLDLKGAMLSSEELATEVNKRAAGGVSEFTFVIGGSRGVSDEVKNRADLTVAFGKITYPHQLMRVVLAEQIYRLLTIINNTSYHK